MKKHLYLLVSSVLLLSVVLSGCGAKQDFRYTETYESDKTGSEEKFTLVNDVEFSYQASDDHAENVINFQSVLAAGVFVDNEKLYLNQYFTPVLYDAATDRRTSLCTDPLCDHYTPDCPFMYSVLSYGFYVIDDKVLYHWCDGRSHQVRLYSMTDRTVKVLRTVEGNLFSSNMIALEDSYFYTDIIYDEESDTYTYSFCRQMYDSGKIEVFRTEKNYDTVPLGVDGDTVYIHDLAEEVLIAYDLDGKNEKYRTPIGDAHMAICKDGYIIFEEDGELMRMNLDGSDRHSLGITGVDYLYLTDSYVYYRTVEKRIDGIVYEYEGDRESYVELQAIYRVDHEGKNKELIWKNQDETNIFIFCDFVADGNYIYANFTHCRVNGEELIYTFNQFTTYCRLDCTTGEKYYIYLEE